MRTMTKDWASRLRMAGAACIIAMGSAVTAQAQITLNEIARFNLNSTSGTANAEFIGQNPGAVAWNGQKLYVAGFLSATGTASIVEVTNPTATGFVTPTYSSVFGSLPTPGSRGYGGLAIKNSVLAAAWNNGSSSTSSMQSFTTAGNTRLWNLSASGTSSSQTNGQAGVAFDPGVSGTGAGVAWSASGAGRRAVWDSVTGTPQYVLSGSSTPANPSSQTGALISVNNGGGSTAWRDIDFNPSNGDVYLRWNNAVVKGIRSGPNLFLNGTGGQGTEILVGFSGTPVTVSGSTATVNGENITFMNGVQAIGNNSYAGDVLIFNDRSTTSTTQSWTTNMLFVTTSGSAVTPTWNFLSTPAAGNGYYDFGWDPTTSTLAVMDFQNRNVSIFSVPEPSTTAIAGMCSIGLASLMLRGRRRSENNS